MASHFSSGSQINGGFAYSFWFSFIRWLFAFQPWFSGVRWLRKTSMVLVRSLAIANILWFSHWQWLHIALMVLTAPMAFASQSRTCGTAKSHTHPRRNTFADATPFDAPQEDHRIGDATSRQVVMLGSSPLPLECSFVVLLRVASRWLRHSALDETQQPIQRLG